MSTPAEKESVDVFDVKSDGGDDTITCDGALEDTQSVRDGYTDTSSNSASHELFGNEEIVAPEKVVSLHPAGDPGEPDSQEESVTKNECRKLVYALSRELAFFCTLSLGLGGTSDSDRLREELRRSRARVCALAKRNLHTLIPLLRKKQAEPQNAERVELEKLYRVYSGCLEYLEMQLLKVSNLQAIFPLHTGECLLINTGIVDPILSKSSLFLNSDARSPSGACSPPIPTSRNGEEIEEIERINKELSDIKQLLYHVSSSVDIQPWDVADTPDDKRYDSHDEENQKREKNSTHPVQRSDFTRLRRVWVYVALGVAATLVLIGVVVGVVVFLFAK